MKLLMLKKSALLLTLLLAAFAIGCNTPPVRPGMAGCGGGNSFLRGDTTAGAVLIWLSNGLGIGQGFSISTGTMGCNPRDFRLGYVETNFAGLQHEMAAGQGNRLYALGSMMGCSYSDLPAFGAAMKNGYARLFPASETTPGQLLEATRAEVLNDAHLSASCNTL